MTSRTQRRILAADADPSALRLVESYLEDQPFAVVSVAHGREALRALRDDPSSFSVAVVSINLPGISGLELTKRIKSDERLSHITVVVTATGDASHGSRAECFAAGALACLPKPFSKSQLLALLRLNAAKSAPASPAAGRTLGKTGGEGFAVIHDGSGQATCHVLVDPSTTACGRKVSGDRATEFARERPPGTRACPFCNRP